MWPKTTEASTTARGYGTEHQRARRQLLPYAYGQPCTRCGQPLQPGQPLHLDHNDTRTGYLGFAHASCNRRAGARKGALMQGQAQRSRLDDSRRW